MGRGKQGVSISNGGPMRIAQVSPLYESVPPSLYGGTERVVSYLTEELVSLGHDVTLFASEDSSTSAKLVPVCKRAHRLGHCSQEVSESDHARLIESVVRGADRFDVVHFHLDVFHLPVIQRALGTFLTTVHGRLDLEAKRACYGMFGELPFVSISDAQRLPLRQLNWQKTILHGLPLDLYRYTAKPEGYLAFLGRISPEKGVERAIQIAKSSGMGLRIAAKVDDKDRGYFDEKVSPHIDGDSVVMVGEINEEQKQNFLGDADALLFPVDWPEPFGMVMIEALACGTPVIAYPNGAVPEVIVHGKTGYWIRSIAEGAEAVRRLKQIERAKCREEFETKFSSHRMARDYVEVYQGLRVRGNSERETRRERPDGPSLPRGAAGY